MDKLLLFFTLSAALVLFVWGKLRYDLVAMLALLFLTVWGVVPSETAFTGFAHPAVVTVAAVLVISKALQNSGVIVIIARLLYKTHDKKTLQILALCLITATASGFMNNIGALAILMPVAISLARKGNYPASHILMPIAFASILGGTVTLIGTPPNIIISSFQEEHTGERFGMFAFGPTGSVITLAGILFIAVIGWRFLPARKPETTDEDIYEIDNYITEMVITGKSKLKGLPLSEINTISDADVKILGLVRDNAELKSPAPDIKLQENDILILKTTIDELRNFSILTKTEFTDSHALEFEDEDQHKGNRIQIVEVIIEEGSPLVGFKASEVDLRSRFGVNLLAASKRNPEFSERLRNIKFGVGDVLMLQGESSNIHEAIDAMRCLPLAERGLHLARPSHLVKAIGIFGAAIFATMFDILPVEVSFVIAAVMLVLSGTVQLADLYTSIQWPVIILLGALIPVGAAFETSGAAGQVSGYLLQLGSGLAPWIMLSVLMGITLLLSNIINNAATAVLMAPVALELAGSLQVSPAPFLMGVAIAASCAFLTPIGHQSNTLVMSPGGYKFGDYWKMGLPLTIIILALGVPAVLFFWPLHP